MSGDIDILDPSGGNLEIYGTGNTYVTSTTGERVFHVVGGNTGDVLIRTLRLDNVSESALSASDFGGGCVASEGTGMLEIRAVEFYACNFFGLSPTSTSVPVIPGGGAIATTAPLLVDESAFVQVQAHNALGGAIYGSGEVTVENTTFEGTSAKLVGSKCTGCTQEYEGGAIYVMSSSSLLVLDTVDVWYSSATNSGGAVWSGADEVIVRDSIFRQNRVEDVGNGGAIYILAPKTVGGPIVQRSAFVDNDTLVTGNSGGALAMVQRAGANDDNRIINNTFSGNYAQGTGGALLLNGAGSGTWISTNLQHNTFADNTTFVISGSMNGSLLDSNGITVHFGNNYVWQGINPCVGASTFVSDGNNGSEAGPPISCGMSIGAGDAPATFGLLDPTLDWSGLTPVHKLTAAGPVSCITGINEDQLGTARPSAGGGGSCDFGAWEHP